MKCTYTEGFIVRYLDKEVDALERKAFESHLKLCPKCQGALEQDNRLRTEIAKEIPAKSIPVRAIMQRISEGSRRPKKAPIEPRYIMLLKRYAIPVFSAILLILALTIPEISKPLWGGIMTILNKQERIAAHRDSDTVLVFAGGAETTNEGKLIDTLNERGMGVSPWQVLYADDKKAFFRSASFIVSFRDSSLHLVADLDKLNLNHVQGSIVSEFSFSPGGSYLLAGNNVFEGDNALDKTGLYLFETHTGQYTKLSDSDYNEMIFSWSFDGRYLAYAPKENADKVNVLDSEAKKTVAILKESGPIKGLFINQSGKLSVFTGNRVMSASIQDENWKTAPLQAEPFYIDCEKETAWLVKDGVIIKQALGSDKQSVIDPSSEENDNSLITSYRVTGHYMVYRLDNGKAGIFNLQSKGVKTFKTDSRLGMDYLPWNEVTPLGTRIVFDNDGVFVISDGSDVKAFSIPDYTALSPFYTRWMDEENILYVKLIESNPMRAGEFSIMKLSARTGESEELYRTVSANHDVAENTPAPPQNTDQEKFPEPKATVFEKVKATGNWVESIVTQNAKIKNGPSERYSDWGEVSEGETVLYNDAIVNGWCLAQRISDTEGPKEFWMPSNSLLIYKRYELPAGIITADSVELSGIKLERGNMIRIIKKESDRSFVVPDTIDVNGGITGWIDNSSYTKNTSGVYFNQAYLKSGSVIYTNADIHSDPVPGYLDFVTNDGFVHIYQNDGSFAHISMPGGGISGWVQLQDLYIPTGAPSTNSSNESGYDLDGDGSIDIIGFETDGAVYRLTVNDAVIAGEGMEVQKPYKVVDIDRDDPFKQIVIEELGPSDDLRSTFYYYDGERLHLMGKVEGLCGNSQSVAGNGSVMTQTRGSIFETWFFVEEFKVNQAMKLIPVPRVFYEKINYTDAIPLKLIVPSLSFKASTTGDEVSFVLNQGEEVLFVGSDNKRWCLFKTPDGKLGWLEVKGFSEIAGTGLTANDIFEGVCNAD